MKHIIKVEVLENLPETRPLIAMDKYKKFFAEGKKAEPVGPADNEIWYTTTDSNKYDLGGIIETLVGMGGTYNGPAIVSNEYDAEKEIDKETLFAIFDDGVPDERITNEKELFAAQRQFLVSNCQVPGSLAEGVRKYLMVSLENAESKINASKAKSIAGNKELKQQIISAIKAKYDEYRQIEIETTPVSEVVDPRKQAKKLHKLQREFLQTTCKIPKSFADPVRIYLAEGMDYAVDKITESKAKIFKTNKNLKQQIIENLNNHYEEYQKLNTTF